MKVLEFYSGIGGMHYSLDGINGLDYEVVAAFEINSVANLVYNHNFGHKSCIDRNICGLTASELDTFNADLWTMSPPCQPFTRIGNKMDLEDARTDSFMHILELLGVVDNKPRFIFIENVKGFEESNARNKLIQTLTSCGYVFQEFLASPSELGIPNSRLRYYLTADSAPQNEEKYTTEIRRSFPSKSNHYPKYLKSYFDNQNVGEVDKFLVPEKALKYLEAMDIVDEESCHSCCFTKAYGRFVKGTAGSIIQHDLTNNLSQIYQPEKLKDLCAAEQLIQLKLLKLRFFMPREIANLLGFPIRFCFPDSVSNKQRYRLLGNSISISVVSVLLEWLICVDK